MEMMENEWANAENKVEEEIMTEKVANEEDQINSMESFWEKAMKDYNPEDPQMLEKLQT